MELTPELDHQKSSPRPDLRRAAQSASTWLRDILKSARHTRIRVRLESLLEYRAAQGVYEPGIEIKNDERILKSLTHAYSVGLLLDYDSGVTVGMGGAGGGGGGGKMGGLGAVRLWTEDINFSLMAEAAGLSTVGKCVTLSAVLSGLGLEDQDEGGALDLDGADLFSRHAVQPGLQAPMQPDSYASMSSTSACSTTYATSSTPYATRSYASSTPALHSPSTAARGTRTSPSTPRPGGGGGAMPPPGTLQAAVARLQSQCPASLRPALLSALTLFAARRALPLTIPPLPPVSPSTLSFPLPSSSPPGPAPGPPTTSPPTKEMSDETCEKYFDALLSAVQQLISAVDSSQMALRPKAILGSALRTLLKYVGPRGKGDKALWTRDVKEAVETLDGETGDFRGVLERLPLE